MKENNNKKVVISIIAIVVLIAVVIGVTYAAFTFSKVGTMQNSVTTGTITMTYTEGDNGITINNAMPTTDALGKTISNSSQLFDFTVNVNVVGNTTVSYEVTAVKQDGSTLKNDEVRLYLEKGENSATYSEIMAPSYYTPLGTTDDFGASTGEMVMDTGSTNQTVTYYYRLRMWVNKEYKLNDTAKSFTVKVNVYGKGGVAVQKANSPELIGDMIPVTYDGENWIKADTTSKWYDYDNQMWANAVTIADQTKRATYKSATAGTVISMSDINTMFVWIPRYSYTLGNTYGYRMTGTSTPSKLTPGAFDIKFVDKTTTENGTGKYTGNKADNYYTPSSFCWGDTCDTSRSDVTNTELSGIWVSKFETTGTIDNITSIPNVTSLRGQTNSAFFTAIQSKMNGNNGSTTYGFSGNYDTHMMKNTEWGAMTYLSQSKYGKYGNASYTGANKEIYQNKSSGYITGNSNGTPSTSTTNTQVAYNVELTGTGASTTGTIYGIYDTSGGAWERTMGNLNNGLASSGFSAMPANKYYNLYTTTTSIKGDAMNADGTNGFYGDYQTYMTTSNPWVIRGGRYDNGAVVGMFSFYGYDGIAYIDNSVRLVLVAE